MRIITVSREFGSGGRELGKRLAEALGFAYYDREIITEIAKNTSLNEDYIERTLENGVTRQMYPLTFGHTFAYIPNLTNFSTPLLLQQTEIIKKLATKGDCLIVGRNADVILQEYKPLKMFVFADMPSKIKRCRQREKENENFSDKDYQKKIKQIDQARAKTHNIISSSAWGDMRSYDLCVNTTNIEIKEMIPALCEYAQKWFKQQK